MPPFFVKHKKNSFAALKSKGKRKVLSEKKSFKKKSGNKKAKLDSELRDDNVKFVPGGLNEEIDSGNSSADSEEELELKPHNKKNVDQETEEDVEEETVQEKRLRLAKQYIAEIERQEKERAETLEIDRRAVSHRLKEDLLDQSGKLQKKIADKYEGVNESEIVQLKGHSLSPICVVISPDDQFAYSGSKDCSLIKWCMESKRKLKVIAGGKRRVHGDHIFSLAITCDNKFLASGSKDKLIRIWDPQSLELIHTFRGHRDAVSGLAFRKGSHQLYSASFDRSVKLWELDEMAYVETLFGHQDVITSIDCLSRERAVTSGGRDNTLRVWKIVEESQLVFNGHSGSVDCVRLINEENFISCSDDGSISSWSAMKKKPHVTVANAHGLNQINGEPNWVTCVTALRNHDVIASGSNDGHIRLWKWTNVKNITPLFTIPVVGSVNSLQFTSDGRKLLAAVGQEHRLGRWFANKEARNVILIIPLTAKVPP